MAMTTTKRCFSHLCAVLVSLALVCGACVGAAAAASSAVGVEFWREKSSKNSIANDCVDTDREAELTRLANGTYTLELPVKQLNKMGITGCLTGLTIGDISYDGELSGDVADGTGVLTIKNLPASVLTGADINDALLVTCNIRMDSDLLGTINASARMCIWTK